MIYNLVDVVLVYVNDWTGIYFNGVLQDEGHSVNWLSIMEKLTNKTVLSFKYLEVDEDWLEWERSLPPNLKDAVTIK